MSRWKHPQFPSHWELDFGNAVAVVKVRRVDIVEIPDLCDLPGCGELKTAWK